MEREDAIRRLRPGEGAAMIASRRRGAAGQASCAATASRGSDGLRRRWCRVAKGWRPRVTAWQLVRATARWKTADESTSTKSRGSGRRPAASRNTFINIFASTELFYVTSLSAQCALSRPGRRARKLRACLLRACPTLCKHYLITATARRRSPARAGVPRAGGGVIPSMKLPLLCRYFFLDRRELPLHPLPRHRQQLVLV